MRIGGRNGPFWGEKLPRALRFSLLPAIAALIVPFVASAGTMRGELRVTARVIPRAILVTDEHPSHLEITEQDVERGWLRAEGLIVTRSNDPAGILLAYALRGGAISEVRVAVDDVDTEINAQEAWILRPFRGLAIQESRLTYRLFLSCTARPGVYEWPVSITVTPASR